MAGSTVPRAAAHSGAMSYVRFGAGRGLRGFAAGAAPGAAAGRPGSARRGRSGRSGPACRCCPAPDSAPPRRPDPDPDTGFPASGTRDGSGAGGDAEAGTVSGSRPNGRASTVGCGGRSVRTSVGTSRVPGAVPGASGRTVTHPAVRASATKIRGTHGPRHDSMRPPCRTNPWSPARPHPHGWRWERRSGPGRCGPRGAPSAAGHAVARGVSGFHLLPLDLLSALDEHPVHGDVEALQRGLRLALRAGVRAYGGRLDVRAGTLGRAYLLVLLGPQEGDGDRGVGRLGLDVEGLARVVGDRRDCSERSPIRSPSGAAADGPSTRSRVCRASARLIPPMSTPRTLVPVATSSPASSRPAAYSPPKPRTAAPPATPATPGTVHRLRVAARVPVRGARRMSGSLLAPVTWSDRRFFRPPVRSRNLARSM